MCSFIPKCGYYYICHAHLEVFKKIPFKCLKLSPYSHLGPVLFTLFINDLPSVIIHSNILMYADDVKIFNSLDSISGQSTLQKDIDYFCQRCEVNLLELNFKKCKHMAFHRSFKLYRQHFGKSFRETRSINLTEGL